VNTVQTMETLEVTVEIANTVRDVTVDVAQSTLAMSLVRFVPTVATLEAGAFESISISTAPASATAVNVTATSAALQSTSRAPASTTAAAASNAPASTTAAAASAAFEAIVTAWWSERDFNRFDSVGRFMIAETETLWWGSVRSLWWRTILSFAGWCGHVDWWLLEDVDWGMSSVDNVGQLSLLRWRTVRHRLQTGISALERWDTRITLQRSSRALERGALWQAVRTAQDRRRRTEAGK